MPYTTPVIGTRAFANCPKLALYYSGAFTIETAAFEVKKAAALMILYIPEYETVLRSLSSYDWMADRRMVCFEDVYGISLLATGYCGSCGGTYSYTREYVPWTSEEHCVRYWCSNCGNDQHSGLDGQAHTFRSGVCTKCGYVSDECDHSSTRKRWDGCDWTEYCRDCGEELDYGTSHGTYEYGAWEYYSRSRHRRIYACSDCGEGDYTYAYHTTSTSYGQYSSTQHTTSAYCSTCNTTISTSYSSHSFSYGSWQNYSSSQHRRLKSCSLCGYSEYEYASHAKSYGSWTNYTESLHKRTVTCTCGYSSTETASHSFSYGSWIFSYGSWISSSDTQHSRSKTCTCGYSGKETASHSISYGAWASASDTQHKRTASCSCGYSAVGYEDHADGDNDGCCDSCNYLLTRFSVTVPASLNLTVSKTGMVYAASDAQIVNRSTAEVCVSAVTVTAENGWTLVPYRRNMAEEKVDSRQIGFTINGAESTQTGAAESLPLGGAWQIGKDATLPLTYSAVVSATSQPISEQVLTVVFVLKWAGE